MSDNLSEIIDRAVGKKGIFRIPSWWMHKILTSIVGSLDEMIPLSHDFSNDFNDDFAI